MDGSFTSNLKSFLSSMRNKLKLPSFNKVFSHKNWLFPRDYSSSYIPLVDFNSDAVIPVNSANEARMELRNLEFLLNSDIFQTLGTGERQLSQNKTADKYNASTCFENNSQKRQMNLHAPLENSGRDTGNSSNFDNEVKGINAYKQSQNKVSSSIYLKSNERKISKHAASDMLGALTDFGNNSQDCCYIPLVEFRSNKAKSLDPIRDIRGSLNNIRFEFDSCEDNVDSKLAYTATNMSSNLNKNCSKVAKTSSKFLGASSDRGLCAINGFLLSFHSHTQSKITTKKWTANEYKYTKKDIYANIKYSYRRCLIIWCNLHDVQSDFLHALLKKSSPAFFHDRWIHGDNLYSKNKWGGVVAVYPNRVMAKTAAKEIPLQHEFLRILELSKLIYCLVKSELKYFTVGRTQITINAKIPGRREDLQKVEAILHRFGQVESYNCHHVIKNVAVVFEVEYARATYAFIAKTVLDGLPFGSGLLDVEVKVTPKEKAILEDLPFQMKKFIEDANFPF